MAFNTNTPRVSYIAAAGQTVFPFTFKIFTNTNLTVYKNSAALILSTDYTVTINGDSGGEVTLLVGASLSDEILIVRSLPITREFDYQDNGDFFADTVDNDQDYQTYLVQDVDAKFDRTFTLPDSISGTVNSELPFPINDAYIRWNSDSTAIINDTEIPSAVLLAKDWANKAEDSVVADGEYSAKHYSLKAEDEKEEATTQAGIATTKAGEASTSASQALGYRNEAEGFRDEAQASALSVDSANIVHKTGDETIAGVKTFTSIPIVQGQNVSPFTGFKNYIINGKKVVNQRGLTSTDNSYNQDRWYKVGNNWYQGIEGDNNLISGKTYSLSWVGVATASYYVGNATSATINAQSFTSITNGSSFTLTISAGQNLWIKFASDAIGSTFNFVQLEEGSVATPFEQRPYGLELSLCNRYLPAIKGLGVVGIGRVTATATNTNNIVNFNSIARVPATGVTLSNLSHFSITDGVSVLTPSAVAFNSSSLLVASLTGTTTAFGATLRPSTMSATSSDALILFTGCEL